MLPLYVLMCVLLDFIFWGDQKNKARLKLPEMLSKTFSRTQSKTGK